LDNRRQKNENRIIGTCLSLSNEDGHSSFQSKMAGIYVTLFTLSMLLPPTTETMHFQLACNGKSVLIWF